MGFDGIFSYQAEGFSTIARSLIRDVYTIHYLYILVRTILRVYRNMYCTSLSRNTKRNFSLIYNIS